MIDGPVPVNEPTPPTPIPEPSPNLNQLQLEANLKALRESQLARNESLTNDLPQLKIEVEDLDDADLISRCIEVSQLTKCYDPTESQLWTELLTYIRNEIEDRMQS